MPPRRKRPDLNTAFTYVRVSTEEQTESGLGLSDQRAKVTAACEQRGWNIVHEYADEGFSAKTVIDRPDLTAALNALDAGEAANLVVAKLDRLSRSVHDFTGLVARSKRNSWSLVVLDLGVDTSTAAGQMMANVLATFAQFERELIGERTSAALQIKKRDGMTLGRPDRHPDEVVELIVTRKFDGASYRAIADELNGWGVATSQGGARWYPSTVKAVFARPHIAHLYVRSEPACWEWTPPDDGARTWDDVIAWQAGRCALCGVERTLQNDHSHRTGLRRGQLCATCNIHEGQCSRADCPCVGYRERSPAAILGVVEEHPIWDPLGNLRAAREAAL
jgi:DNA invertase Pin-like site-specific DNA recombinase